MDYRLLSRAITLFCIGKSPLLSLVYSSHPVTFGAFFSFCIAHRSCLNPSYEPSPSTARRASLLGSGTVCSHGSHVCGTRLPIPDRGENGQHARWVSSHEVCRRVCRYLPSQCCILCKQKCVYVASHYL